MQFIKKATISLLCLIIYGNIYGQRLQQQKFYSNQGGESVILSKFGLTGENKRNGFIYRLREDVSVTNLPKTIKTANLELFISEKTDFGYIALYRSALGANEYRFIVVLYNDNREFLKEINLNEISENYNCELQDLRYDDGYLYYNFACPSYSSELAGKCSSLYCLHIDTEVIRWQTPYLVSNNIFTLYSDYIIAGYGFTAEPDYLYLLNRKTGKILSKAKLKSAHEYIEVKNNLIHIIDYQDNVYVFNIL